MSPTYKQIIRQPNGLYAHFDPDTADVVRYGMTAKDTAAYLSDKTPCEVLTQLLLADEDWEEYDAALRLIRQVHGAELATVRHTQMSNPGSRQ